MEPYPAHWCKPTPRARYGKMGVTTMSTISKQRTAWTLLGHANAVYARRSRAQVARCSEWHYHQLLQAWGSNNKSSGSFRRGCEPAVSSSCKPPQRSNRFDARRRTNLRRTCKLTCLVGLALSLSNTSHDRCMHMTRCSRGSAPRTTSVAW